jgi:hypothetical protein
MREFKKVKGFPGVIDAIDGSHIPIAAPSEYPVDYFNRKSFYSVILQAVVDSKGRFLDIFTGYPGSTHDSRVLRNSKIYHLLNTIKPHPDNSYILGDCGYPNLDWLITPYKDNGHLTEKQSNFNYKHSVTRICVEQAFGRLKSRWRVLTKTLEQSLEVVSHIITVSCILHNICEEENDILDDAEIHFDEHLGQTDTDEYNNNLRDSIADYLWRRRTRIIDNSDDEN